MSSGCPLESAREDRELTERESGAEVEVEIRLECAREPKTGCREGGIESLPEEDMGSREGYFVLIGGCVECGVGRSFK